MNVRVLRAALPRAPLPWLEACVELLPQAGIDTSHEIASFLAQCAHESVEFTHLQENLNYSAERLMVVWPRRFTTLDLARQYEHNPEHLANYVYANRLGNGDTASGDGWAFRGRGPLQITGRRNYDACGYAIGHDLLSYPNLLLEPFPGIRSAIWYWRTANLDEVDDDEDVRIETRRINGGEIGLAHRQTLFNHVLRHLEAA